MKTKIKTLRKYTPTLYGWRDYELSLMTWLKMPMWNFCRSGSLKNLPDGKESKMFSSLAEASEYVSGFGFKISGLVPSGWLNPEAVKLVGKRIADLEKQNAALVAVAEAAKEGQN